MKFNFNFKSTLLTLLFGCMFLLGSAQSTYTLGVQCVHPDDATGCDDIYLEVKTKNGKKIKTDTQGMRSDGDYKCSITRTFEIKLEGDDSLIDLWLKEKDTFTSDDILGQLIGDAESYVGRSDLVFSICGDAKYSGILKKKLGN